ncbi:rod shape-determining protein [Komagataeibacter sp. FNDCF1]|uniref:rod shape-determining protein n=1 Tax=Komagataeibacter sp. FNDCF1 TaxID=2878681 RepID=UPI001E57A18D|nr:rod shape-determining protein [Komagataeibacter sp. FNDCF1]MCE2565789.1 rod shape-determining protein [Komagataeibacter sp. FNDCF1]
MKNFTPPPIRPGIHPRSGLGYLIDNGVRSAVPSLFVFFVTLVLSAPLNLPGQVELMPALVMGTVFLWSVFVPVLMPSLVVFVLGLWVDILSFGPAGVMLLMMLIVHGVALSARYTLARVNFFVLWLVFGVVMVGVTALQWVLCSALALHIVEFLPFVFETVLSFGSFPVLYAGFVWTYRFVVNNTDRS